MSKHHVVPHGEGWAVKAEGSSRASAVFDKQEEAIAAAKKIAANQGGVVLIHRPDGTIRSERVERITGTITVDVESGESLDEVKRKIERADKRLKALAAAVAAKQKTSDRKAGKAAPKKAAAAKKPAAKKAVAAKKPVAKKAAPKKAAAAKKPAAKKAVAAKKPVAKKAAPKKAAAAKKPVAKKAAPRKASAVKKTGVPKKPAAKKAAPRKAVAAKKPAARKAAPKRTAKKGEAGFLSIISGASKAIRKLAAKR